MVNIVHSNIHFDDERRITALELKLKSINNGEILIGQPMITTISMALSKTTLLKDSGKTLKITQNPKRGNIVDLTISLEKDSEFTIEDYAKFHAYFQEALDTTKLF